MRIAGGDIIDNLFTIPNAPQEQRPRDELPHLIHRRANITDQASLYNAQVSPWLFNVFNLVSKFVVWVVIPPLLLLAAAALIAFRTLRMPLVPLIMSVN